MFLISVRGITIHPTVQGQNCHFFNIYFYFAVMGLNCTTLDLFSCGLWDLVPLPGNKPGPPALGAWSASHWTTKEVCEIVLFDHFLFHTPCTSSSIQSLLLKSNSPIFLSLIASSTTLSPELWLDPYNGVLAASLPWHIYFHSTSRWSKWYFYQTSAFSQR